MAREPGENMVRSKSTQDTRLQELSTAPMIPAAYRLDADWATCPIPQWIRTRKQFQHIRHFVEKHTHVDGVKCI